DGADTVSRRAAYCSGNRRKRLVPRNRLQAAVLADIWPVQTLRTQAIPYEAGLVGNPFLIHRFIGDRHDAHDLASARIDADRRTNRVHHVDRLGLGKLPWTRLESIGLG